MIKTTSKNSSVSERTRLWIDNRYGHNGQFTMLERESKISVQKWKNLYYKRQGVTPEMLNFIQLVDEQRYAWILSPSEDLPTESLQKPALAKPSKKLNLKQRLIWLIEEWAAPRGEALCKYLEQRSKKKISYAMWMAMMYGSDEPTLEMVVIVCQARPEFTHWILHGKSFVVRESDDDTEINGHLKEHIEMHDENKPVIDGTIK